MLKTYRESFDTLAEFLAAVVAADVPGGGVYDNRLEPRAAATGAGEAIPSEGGFLVPSELAGELWTAVYDHGQLLDRCALQPVTRGDGIKIPAIDETSRDAGSRFGGVRLFWTDEGETATATKPKYREISLKPKKLLGISYATEELVADAPALAAWLTRTFGLEAAFEVENNIINGSGAGRPLGIVNSDAVIAVAKESGQAADTVVAANLTNMAARLWSPSHANAAWLAGNAVFAQLADDQFANGTPVVVYGPNGGRFILGMPLVLSEYPAAIGDVGDIVLADFSQYAVAEKEPESLSSIHVRFLYDEMTFRFRYRVDGQPLWRSPVTPKNSSTTQSPFVVLAERA